MLRRHWVMLACLILGFMVARFGNYILSDIDRQLPYGITQEEGGLTRYKAPHSLLNVNEFLIDKDADGVSEEGIVTVNLENPEQIANKRNDQIMVSLESPDKQGVWKKIMAHPV